MCVAMHSPSRKRSIGKSSSVEASKKLRRAEEHTANLALAVEQDEESDAEDSRPVFAGTQSVHQAPSHSKASQSDAASSASLSNMSDDVYHNNLLNMQLHELDKEMSLKRDQLQEVEESIWKLKSVFESVPSASLAPSTHYLGASLPHYVPPPPSFQFVPPTRFEIIGSYMLQTAALPIVNIDLLVEMPDECMLPKDFLYYRYSAKFYAYLHHLALALHGEKQYALSKSYYMGQLDKPVLCVELAQIAGSKALHSRLIIRVIMSLSQDKFKASRLGPDKVNLKSSGSEGADPVASTLYNQALLNCQVLHAQYAELSSFVARVPAIKECMGYISIWSRNRGLSPRSSDPKAQSSNGWGYIPLVIHKRTHINIDTNRTHCLPHAAFDFHCTSHFYLYFLYHLHSLSLIQGHMSSLQILKIFFTELFQAPLITQQAHQPGQTQGIVCGFNAHKARAMHELLLQTNPHASSSSVELAQLSAFQSHSEVVFLTQQGNFNLAYNITHNHMYHIKYAIFLTLYVLDHNFLPLHKTAHMQQLNSNADNNKHSLPYVPILIQQLQPTLYSPLQAFQHTFLSSGDWSSQWDVYVRMPIPSAEEVEHSALHKLHSFDPSLDTLSLTLRMLAALIQEGLTDRYTLCSFKPVAHQATHYTHIDIGLLCHPAHSLRVLDIGPDADSPQANHFRLFWSSLSNLRRFKDGRIVEAVIWQQDAQLPHLIMPNILTFLLHTYFLTPQAHIHFVCQQLDSLLYTRHVSYSQQTPDDASLAQVTHMSKPIQPPNIQQTPLLMQTFTALSQHIKQLKGLSLSILAIRAVHSAFRYTHPFPPARCNNVLLTQPNQLRYCLPILPCMLQFESHNQWPHESIAIARVKSAFYIQIGKLLNQQHDIHSCVQIDALNILYEGYVFQLRIFYEGEVAIRASEEKDGMSKLGGPTLPIWNSKDIERHFVFQPMLHQYIKSVQEQYMWYGPTTRIVKRCFTFTISLHGA